MDTYIDDDGTIWLGDNAGPFIDVLLDCIEQEERDAESAA